MGEKPPFKSTIHGQKPFVNEKRTFGLDKDMPQVFFKKINIYNFKFLFRKKCQKIPISK